MVLQSAQIVEIGAVARYFSHNACSAPATTYDWSSVYTCENLPSIHEQHATYDKILDFGIFPEQTRICSSLLFFCIFRLTLQDDPVEFSDVLR